MISFQHGVNAVLKWEGGYVNDPNDRGKATNFGISLRFALGLGDSDGDGRLDLDIDGDGDIDADDIRIMPKAKAEEIYYEHFWKTCGCDKLPEGIAVDVFDAGVNQGQPTARRLLQRCVGVNSDGILGPKTFAAIDRHIAVSSGRIDLIKEFSARRALHYSRCSQVDLYGLGWYRRLFDVTAYCFDLESGSLK